MYGCALWCSQIVYNRTYSLNTATAFYFVTEGPDVPILVLRTCAGHDAFVLHLALARIGLYFFTCVADTLWSVHTLHGTPICWGSTMQSDALSLWEICSLLGINNAKWCSLTLRNLLLAGNQEQIILSYQTQWHSRESAETESKMQTYSLYPRKERRPNSKKNLNENVFVISVIAQRCKILCTVLGRWTNKLHTPLKLTNEI